MEEKVIVKSEQYRPKQVFMIFGIVAAVLGIILWFACCQWWVGPQIESHIKGKCYWDYPYNGPCGKGLFRCLYDEWTWYVYFCFLLGTVLPVVCVLLLGVLACKLIKTTEITVTDKRVYGKTCFGRSVDLPLDSVSAVGSSWFKGIAVATSSGNISFLFIKNAKVIHEAIRKLLIARQEEKKQVVQPAQAVSGADDLVKYKQLLDQGIITQEEFDAKKKQILGL